MLISRKEISTSAINAVTTPNCPGNVTAYSIGGSVKVAPKRKATAETPSVPPIKCAMTKNRASHGPILPRRRNARVMAGFMWAPERFPQGEWIKRVRVAPTESARITSRVVSPGRNEYRGDLEESSNEISIPTEIIRHPRPPPSIRYSGQCLHSASTMDISRWRIDVRMRFLDTALLTLKFCLTGEPSCGIAASQCIADLFA